MITRHYDILGALADSVDWAAGVYPDLGIYIDDCQVADWMPDWMLDSLEAQAWRRQMIAEGACVCMGCPECRANGAPVPE